MQTNSRTMAALVTLLCIFLSLTVSSVAAELKTSGTVSQQSSPVVVEPGSYRLAMATTPRAAEQVNREPRNINLDFHAADITDVLKALSVQTDTNIVTSTDVKGQVTVSLNHVSMSEALDMITKLSGYRYTKTTSNTYLVGSPQALGSMIGEADLENMVVDAVAIRHANANDLAKSLKEQFQNLKISVQEQKASDPINMTSSVTSSASTSDQTETPQEPESQTFGKKATANQVQMILLSGMKKDVEAAKDVISKIEDSLREEAENTNVEIYKLKYANAAQAVAMLTSVLPNLTVTTGPTTGLGYKAPSGTSFGTANAAQANTSIETEAPRTLILSGTPTDLKKAMDILGQVDKKPKQILIEAKVTDISLGDEQRLGISWSWDNLTMGEGAEADKSGTGAWKRLPLGVEGQIDAMLKDNNAKLLANPTVAALENKPATIFIGDEIKYIIRVEETATGSNIATETASVGITLRVVAQATEDGYITLALHPEVSTITDWLNIGTDKGGNNETTAITLPQIARRYTDHVIRVKDGESIVIGGLIKDSELKNMSNVPVLSKLPFFGGLFRHRENTKVHSEIAVFLKATVMSED